MNSAKQRQTFISYSRKDKAFALKLARELKSAGYSVWLDQLDIPTGARWDNEVERALKDCEIFLIIMTPASVASENVRDEIGYAIHHRKRILPVMLEECEIPFRLARFQYVNFTEMEFDEGIESAKQLLDSLLNEQSTPAVTIHSEVEPQKPASQEATSAATLPNKSTSVQHQRMWMGAGVLVFAAVLGALFIWRDRLFPQTPLISSSVSWAIDTTGVCRDDEGDYPRWSEYSWPLEKCVEVCQGNPNCQGLAMSKDRDYCQLLGSDGYYGGTDPNAEITRGDPEQPQYACYFKSDDPSIVTWTIDTAGVCRDEDGDYPAWSEYSWTLGQCLEACQNDPDCQGLAMSKQREYCQLFGSDGYYGGTDPDAEITKGDSSEPQYTCYIKR